MLLPFQNIKEIKMIDSYYNFLIYCKVKFIFILGLAHSDIKDVRKRL